MPNLHALQLLHLKKTLMLVSQLDLEVTSGLLRTNALCIEDAFLYVISGCWAGIGPKTESVLMIFQWLLMILLSALASVLKVVMKRVLTCAGAVLSPTCNRVVALEEPQLARSSVLGMTLALAWASLMSLGEYPLA